FARVVLAYVAITRQHLSTAGTHSGTRGRKKKPPQQPLGRAKRHYSCEPTVTGEQIKSASLGSLIGGRGASSGVGAGRGVRIPHQGSVWQRYRHELSAVVAVAKRMNDGLNFHAGRKGLGNPALPRQTGRSAHLDRPLLCLTLGIVDRHQDPAVRIGPLEFLHSAL